MAIKVIYAKANKLGLCDRSSPKTDDLHAVVYKVTGKTSIASLNDRELSLVIKELERYSGGTKVSEAQIKKMYYIMHQIEKYDREKSKVTTRERIAGVIRKVTKMSVSNEKPFIWVDSDAGGRVIEEMKKYLRTLEKRNKER